jgi:hypothetical protein
MRVAYLIMVHRNARQVEMLLRALPEDASVFVHIDARVSRAVYDELAGLRDQRPFELVRRYRCYWGRIGMVRATIALARAALAASDEWDYVSLLSGSDYPIASHERLSAFLSDHEGEEFMSFWDMRSETNPWKNAPGRMQSDSRVDRRHVGAGRHMVRSPWRRSMPYGLHPYGGSQWWTLSRAAVDYLVRYVDDHPRFLPFMRGVFVPDECTVQTVLGNSPFREAISGSDLRYVDWSRPEPPYPAVLMTADLETIGGSGAMYARKFDLDADPRVFEEIDRRLRGSTASGSECAPSGP